MDHEQHYLLNYLDQPARFLFFTLDEFFILLLPLMIGFWFMWAFTGLLCSVGGFLALRLLKKNTGNGSLRNTLYWHLPTSPRHMKLLIPSHIREFMG